MSGWTRSRDLTWGATQKWKYYDEDGYLQIIIDDCWNAEDIGVWGYSMDRHPGGWQPMRDVTNANEAKAVALALWRMAL